MSIAGYNVNKTNPLKRSLVSVKPIALDDSYPAVESLPRQDAKMFHKNKSPSNE